VSSRNQKSEGFRTVSQALRPGPRQWEPLRQQERTPQRKREAQGRIARDDPPVRKPEVARSPSPQLQEAVVRVIPRAATAKEAWTSSSSALPTGMLTPTVITDPKHSPPIPPPRTIASRPAAATPPVPRDLKSTTSARIVAARVWPLSPPSAAAGCRAPQSSPVSMPPQVAAQQHEPPKRALSPATTAQGAAPPPTRLTSGRPFRGASPGASTFSPGPPQVLVTQQPKPQDGIGSSRRNLEQGNTHQPSSQPQQQLLQQQHQPQQNQQSQHMQRQGPPQVMRPTVSGYIGQQQGYNRTSIVQRSVSTPVIAQTVFGSRPSGGPTWVVSQPRR